jgi:hypothetical protein
MADLKENTYKISDYDRLIHSNKQNTPKHILCGICIGKVNKVYDGDTIWIALNIETPNGRSVEYVSLRMYGYDAPEMKGPTKSMAIQVRDRVRECILNKIVVVNLCPTLDKNGNPENKPILDKYGRNLGDIFVMPVDASKSNTIELETRDIKLEEYISENFQEIVDSQCINFNRWVESHLNVKPYFGGTKEKFELSTTAHDKK